MPRRNRFLSGKKIDPSPIRRNATVTQLIEKYFQAYNAGKFSEACQLFVNKMLEPDVTVGILFGFQHNRGSFVDIGKHVELMMNRLRRSADSVKHQTTRKKRK